MENMSNCRGKSQKYKPTLSKIPGFRIPRIYNVPVSDIFKRSFFNDRWDGLGGVETRNIENESAAARTRKDPVEFRGQGYDPSPGSPTEILRENAVSLKPLLVSQRCLVAAPLGFEL